MDGRASVAEAAVAARKNLRRDIDMIWSFQWFEIMTASAPGLTDDSVVGKCARAKESDAPKAEKITAGFRMAGFNLTDSRFVWF
jgi:hypothetical protein